MGVLCLVRGPETKVLKTFLYLLAFGLLAFVAGFFFSPTPGTHEQIFLFLVNLPVVLLLACCWKRLQFDLSEPFFLFTLAVLFYLALSSLWSPKFELATLVYFGRRILTLLSLFVAVLLVVRRFPDFEKLLVWVLVLLASISAVFVLIHHFHEVNSRFALLSITKGSFLSLGRYNTTIRVGWIWGGSCLCTLWLFMRIRGWTSLLLAFLFVPQFILFILTLSRGPLLAFLLSGLIVFVLNIRSFQEKKKLLIILAFLTVAIASLVGFDLTDKLTHGFTRGWTPDTGLSGLSHRLEIWQAVVQETRGSFILGQGFARKVPVTVASGMQFPHSHNFLVSVFRFSGLLGVLLVGMHLSVCLWISISHKNHRTRIWGLLLFYGCLCLLTNGKYPLAGLSEFWFIYWLPICMIYGLRTMNKYPQMDDTP